MTVEELAALLLTLPHGLDVCVPDYANNQTTDEFTVTVEPVYGTDCVVIAAVEEDEWVAHG